MRFEKRYETRETERENKNMKRNYSRGFVARGEDSHPRSVHAGFKKEAQRVFRSLERKAMREIKNGHREVDETVFPSKVQHGEDIWYHD